ncbi:spore germination protein GerPE [Paenibacillus pinihumi]|uniref:spore germination protein GerPE n=1 Tax=Paenibacillus pinihumi TaxID=669462 RepID=UPI00040AA14E|nr:spore germination protein GerPE [Paenibacillus pinihumi]
MQQCGSRTSCVKKIDVTNVSLSGIVQLGDHSDYTPVLRALAVQRETDHGKEDNVYFESYPIFSRELPDACDYPFFRQQTDDAYVDLYTVNHNPNITVGSIHALGIGASSLLQIGNGCQVKTESRIKNIRQFAAAHPFTRMRPLQPGANVFPR